MRDSFTMMENFVEIITQKDVNFIGFFQSETYFKNIEDEVRKDFTFKKNM